MMHAYLSLAFEHCFGTALALNARRGVACGFMRICVLTTFFACCRVLYLCVAGRLCPYNVRVSSTLGGVQRGFFIRPVSLCCPLGKLLCLTTLGGDLGLSPMITLGDDSGMFPTISENSVDNCLTACSVVFLLN